MRIEHMFNEMDMAEDALCGDPGAIMYFAEKMVRMGLLDEDWMEHGYHYREICRARIDDFIWQQAELDENSLEVWR